MFKAFMPSKYLIYSLLSSNTMKWCYKSLEMWSHIEENNTIFGYREHI